MSLLAFLEESGGAAGAAGAAGAPPPFDSAELRFLEGGFATPSPSALHEVESDCVLSIHSTIHPTSCGVPSCAGSSDHTRVSNRGVDFLLARLGTIIEIVGPMKHLRQRVTTIVITT